MSVMTLICEGQARVMVCADTNGLTLLDHAGKHITLTYKGLAWDREHGHLHHFENDLGEYVNAEIEDGDNYEVGKQYEIKRMTL